VRLEHVAERLRRIARHFGGRITCRIWRRHGNFLSRTPRLATGAKRASSHEPARHWFINSKLLIDRVGGFIRRVLQRCLRVSSGLLCVAF
jgi:hypothetical protein